MPFQNIPAAGSPASPSITIAGQTFTTNLNNFKIFGFFCSMTPTNCASPLTTLSNPLHGYKVPTGKKLVLVGFTGTQDTSIQVNGALLGFGYGDNDVNLDQDPTHIVNAVPAVADMQNGWVLFKVTDNNGDPLEQRTRVEVPEGKYPFALAPVENGGVITVGIAYGFEIDANATLY